MGEMLSPSGDKLFSVTDVTAQEIFGISILKRMGKVFKSAVVDEWIDDFLRLRISRFRLGRREFVIFGSGQSEKIEARKKGKATDLYSGLKNLGFIPSGFLLNKLSALGLSNYLSFALIFAVAIGLNLFLFRKEIFNKRL